jgi:hypothetical protein
MYLLLENKTQVALPPCYPKEEQKTMLISTENLAKVNFKGDPHDYKTSAGVGAALVSTFIANTAPTLTNHLNGQQPISKCRSITQVHTLIIIMHRSILGKSIRMHCLAPCIID